MSSSLLVSDGQLFSCALRWMDLKSLILRALSRVARRGWIWHLALAFGERRPKRKAFFAISGLTFTRAKNVRSSVGYGSISRRNCNTRNSAIVWRGSERFSIY